MSRYTHVHKEEHVPLGEGWVILKFSSIYVPGDERSRTHPGHGYPESHEPVTLVLYFSDVEEWEEHIKFLLHEHEAFVALRVQRPSIKQTVQIDIEHGS